MGDGIIGVCGCCWALNSYDTPEQGAEPERWFAALLATLAEDAATRDMSADDHAHWQSLANALHAGADPEVRGPFMSEFVARYATNAAGAAFRPRHLVRSIEPLRRPDTGITP